MDYNPNRAGSLTLKSTMPMEYGRTVLTNKWYLKRESEPRDYDLWSGNKPNLQQSTYKILGKQLDNDIAATSAETETKFKHQEALRLKQLEDEADRLDTVKEMVDEKNKTRLNQNLDTYGNLENSINQHKKDHDQQHLETTYNKDFAHPDPVMLHQKSEKMIQRDFQDTVDNSWCYRRQVSQFSDIDGPKRTGVNTYHVQHGEYPNQVVKHKMHASQDNQIFEMKHFTRT